MKGKILECQMECLLMAKVPVSITPHLFLMVLTMKLLKSIQRLSGASLLILANKQDLKGALTPNEIAKMLKVIRAMMVPFRPVDLDNFLLDYKLLEELKNYNLPLSF
ncbi:uncharacterized protein LOC122724587 isoform X2 [Manihot esculenta]|uniref:uncharacterized protein LOC122724587 isoform X2 n=1 Tax=Manihot esculenta TaxID=3983 RepID=UPI001CC8273D|nr:uncharacterized protein LOC122724587 isoform X2 [Manihot esculenta]